MSTQENVFKQSISLRLIHAGRQDCSDFHSWGPGMRDCYILHYVLSGKGYFEVNGNKFNLSAGQTFIIYPYTTVYYYPDKDEPWEYMWVNFTGSEAELLMRQTGFSLETPVSPVFPARHIAKTMNSIIENLEPSAGKIYRATGYLYILISYLIESFPSERSKDDGYSYVQNAVNYITAHCHQPLTIQETADYLNISRTHLYRLFRRHLSMSPNEYLLQLRIRNACSMLADSGLPVKSIAYSLGFDNSLYFAKVFRRVNGVTPSEYRKRCQNSGK